MGRVRHQVNRDAGEGVDKRFNNSNARKSVVKKVPVKKVSAKQATVDRPVLVTTEHRGVFFGYSSYKSGSEILLKKIRNCLYWDSTVKGFIGLAVTGPTSSCRVGPAGESANLTGVTGVFDCSPQAVENWEKSPWR